MSHVTQLNEVGGAVTVASRRKLATTDSALSNSNKILSDEFVLKYRGKVTVRPLRYPSFGAKIGIC